MSFSKKIRTGLSEPLLTTGSRPKSAGAMKLKSMSYPFSQQELLAEEKIADPEKSDVERLASAASRLQSLSEPIGNLFLSSYTSEAARAAIYQRARPAEMLVPSDGPSWQQVACIVATTLIGAGVLGLPYAMRQAGWFGIVLILATTGITSITAKMLVWSFNELNGQKATSGDIGTGYVATYDQLAEEIGQFVGYGPLASNIMKCLTVLECYGCAVCYVVLHSVNWPVVLSLPDVLLGWVPSEVASVSVWAACVLPLLLVKIRYLAVFGSIGLVAVVRGLSSNRT